MSQSASSRYLGSLAIKGLNSAGDAMVPGDETFPSFSRLGAAEHVDRVLDDLPQADRDGVAVLLAIFGILPGFFVKALFAFLEWLWLHNLPMGSVGRQIRIGLRGIVFSLYYSGLKGKAYTGASPTELLEYNVSVYLKDLGDLS